MFEAATNREEYYKLLAQKLYHIRKELEDRKCQKKSDKEKITWQSSEAADDKMPSTPPSLPPQPSIYQSPLFSLSASAEPVMLINKTRKSSGWFPCTIEVCG